MRDVPQYKAWRQIVKDQVLARNLSPLANFPIADFQQIVAGMRRLLPTCDQLATASAVNNIVNMQRADEGVVQLVKDCIDKLTTTLNRHAQKVANGQVLGPIGQPGLSPAQLIIPGLLLPPGAPAQWGPATADPNPAPVPQKALPGINQPQARGQVVAGVFPGQGLGVPPPQPPINQQQAQGQAVPSVVQAQPQAQINQPQGQVVLGVIQAQPQPQINQAQGQPQGQVVPGCVQAQPQAQMNQPQGQVDPGVVQTQPQPQIN